MHGHDHHPRAPRRDAEPVGTRFEAVARRGEGVVRRSESLPRRSLTPVQQPVGPATVGRAAVGVTAGVALTAGLTVAGTVAQPAAAAGCRAPSSFSTVSVTSSSSNGRAAACFLRSAGYSASSSGVKSFQKRYKISASGRVTGATWAALLTRGPNVTLKLGAKGSNVTRLQRGLRALGHPVAVDGVFGVSTRSAVRAIQAKQHWTQSGIAGGGTWNVLHHGGVFVGAVPHKASTAKTLTRGEKALSYAKRQLGDAYRYGSAGPRSFDCSGLTMAAWRYAGVKLPHNSTAQYRYGKHISKSQLRPGDLVFFYSGRSHVAIYAGGGKVIHAPHAGAKVSYIKMKYMPYNGAVRPG